MMDEKWKKQVEDLIEQIITVVSKELNEFTTSELLTRLEKIRNITDR